MKKLIKKSMSLLLTGVMLLGMTTPVFATVKETNTVTTDRTTETEVIYNQESSFMVRIPKLIDLGSDKLTNYTVGVSGDISSDEVIKVVPEDSFLMKDISGGENPKADITATVTQDKTEWIFNEFDIIGNGNVSAPDLTSGKWQGSFWFNINLEKNILEPGLYDANGVMLCAWEDSGIDIDQPLYWPDSSKQDTARYIINNIYPETIMVVLPNNIETIGSYEFYECDSLETIIIPDSVTDIRTSVFYGCDNLENIVIPSSVKYIGEANFKKTKWLTNKQNENPLVIVNEILVDATTTTGKVEIPNSVTEIGHDAFKENSNITNLIIPDSITTIRTNAFYNCKNLSNIIIPNSVTEIEQSAFWGCESFTDITIPNGITYIDNYLFSYCYNLTNITIPESVTNYGMAVFRDVPWFTNKQAENPLVIVNGVLIDGSAATGDVIIPDNVKYISDDAFSDNYNINSVTITDNVIAIYGNSFTNCHNLYDITLSNNIQYVNADAFYGTPWIKTKREENPLVIINDILIDGEFVTGDIVIPDNVKTIAAGAFANNYEITSIVLPENITRIENNTFSSCTNLTNIKIPDNITYIDFYAFNGCSKLENITIPKNVTYIGSGTFSYCDNLTNIIFEDPTNWYYVNPFNYTTKPVDVSDSTSNNIYFTSKNIGKYLIKK
jgi:hypothetical protein